MSAPPRVHSPCAPEGRLPRYSPKHRSRTHPGRRTQPWFRTEQDRPALGGGR